VAYWAPDEPYGQAVAAATVASVGRFYGQFGVPGRAGFQFGERDVGGKRVRQDNVARTTRWHRDARRLVPIGSVREWTLLSLRRQHQDTVVARFSTSPFFRTTIRAEKQNWSNKPPRGRGRSGWQTLGPDVMDGLGERAQEDVKETIKSDHLAPLSPSPSTGEP